MASLLMQQPLGLHIQTTQITVICVMFEYVITVICVMFESVILGVVALMEMLLINTILIFSQCPVLDWRPAIDVYSHYPS